MRRGDTGEGQEDGREKSMSSSRNDPPAFPANVTLDSQALGHSQARPTERMRSASYASKATVIQSRLWTTAFWANPT